MFRKFFVFSMIIVLFTTQANAATHNNLKHAFDELNYALTVEWDQTDRAFYQSQVDKFSGALDELQKQGISNQELIQFAVDQVKDESMKRDLRTELNMVVITKMSKSEAQRFVTDIMNKSYSRGASWNGGAVIGVVVFVILIAVVAIIAGKARVIDNDGCFEVWTCDDYCTGKVCYEDCRYECVN